MNTTIKALKGPNTHRCQTCGLYHLTPSGTRMWVTLGVTYAAVIVEAHLVKDAQGWRKPAVIVLCAVNALGLAAATYATTQTFTHVMTTEEPLIDHITDKRFGS